MLRLIKEVVEQDIFVKITQNMLAPMSRSIWRICETTTTAI